MHDHTMNSVDLKMLHDEQDASICSESINAYQPRFSHEVESTLNDTGTAYTTSIADSDVIHDLPSPTQLKRIPTHHDQNVQSLYRIQTAKSQHSATVGRDEKSGRGRELGPLPEFGAGKPYPPMLPDQEEYVVEFNGADDPLHPQNWPVRKKILTGAMLGYTTLVSAFASSIFSAATTAVAKQYGVSSEVGILGISLYVLGFATGPTIWAPLSELKGRRLPIVLSMFGFSIFQVAVATAENIQTVLICRFWGGFFGACPLAVVAAIFSDMFGNRTRGLAITIFAMTIFCGPLLAPLVGGFITESSLGWRWTEYLVCILGFFAFLLDLFFFNETYPPVVLATKAAELRRRTKNWGIHSKQEEIEIDLKELVTKNFSRPMRLLFTEPIVFLISLYMSFIYGILYLFLTAYPLVFQGVYGMSAGIGGLPFLGMVVGMMIAGIYIVCTQPAYNRKLDANNGVPIPEWRLMPVIIGGAAFAAGLFWFAWSGYSGKVHWIVPTLSGLLTGFGLLAIFLQLMNYLVDAYLMFAASAIAANTFLRSLAGAAFPLYATYMFDGMGIQWAGTLLGCVAVALFPIPVIFYVYGARIRSRSAYKPVIVNTARDEEEVVLPRVEKPPARKSLSTRG